MDQGSAFYNDKNIRVGLLILISIASIFLAVWTIQLIVQFRDHTSAATPNTISVSGEGDVFAVADTATFSFTVNEQGTTATDAQNKATPIVSSALAYLKAQGIPDADITTTDYSVYPQYQVNNNQICGSGLCPQGQTVSSYNASQTIQVKVEDSSKAGTLLTGLGGLGVSNISGLTFTVANPDDLQRQARQKAIADAKTKAQELASDLGVHLGAITSFSENSTSPIVPLYAANTAAVPSLAPAPAQIPQGQNKISSDVSITYDIY